MTQEEWDTVINVNLSALFTTTQAVLPHMREAGYGRIISASSVNGFVGAFGQTNYSATKAGVAGFTRALAREVGRFGITANAIAPGFIESEMTASMPPEVVESRNCHDTRRTNRHPRGHGECLFVFSLKRSRIY